MLGGALATAAGYLLPRFKEDHSRPDSAWGRW